MDYKKKSTTQYNSKPCETLRRTLQTPRQKKTQTSTNTNPASKKSSTQHEIKPCETLR
jgi:hypothetical protein